MSDPTSPPPRIYRARILTPVPAPGAAVPPLRFEEDGALVVGAGGRILSVEPYARAAHPIALDLHPHVLTPGFADVHLHFPQTRVIGRATGPLLDWLDRTVFPEEQRFSDEAYAREVGAELMTRMLSAGTTCSGLYASSSPVATRVAFEVAERAGVLAQIGLVLMDRGAPDGLLAPRDRALADLAALLADCHRPSGDLRLAITPRFALSCSPELLRAAGAFAGEHALLVQTHLSENEVECEATLAAFPGTADYLGVYEACGLSADRSLFAHAIHLTDSEWDRIAAAKARIAHCPDSNFFLGSGRMRLREALRRGVRVGLGSDVAAGRTFDMRRIAASAYDTALAERDPVTPEELFSLATWCGADVLGFGDRTGALTPGRRADFLALDVPAYARTCEEVLAHVLFASDATPVRRTYVAGQIPR
ncbi:MAG: guanine deaminase [Polyangiaceae bacterium]